jgi:hypothetical protein
MLALAASLGVAGAVFDPNLGALVPDLSRRVASSARYARSPFPPGVRECQPHGYRTLRV